MQHSYRANLSMATCETERGQSAVGCRPLPSRRVPSYHWDLDLAGHAKIGAWNFRSTELEDGITRTRRTVFTRRCGVGEIAGWTCRRQANAAIPANRFVKAFDSFAPALSPEWTLRP